MKAKLVLAIIFLAMFGCSKSSDPAPSIVGTWKYVSTVKTSCTNAASNTTETCTTGCATITFNASGTYSTSTGISGTYTVSGSRVTLSASGLPATVTITSTSLTTVEDKDSISGCIRTTTYTRV
jgi:heat shock protein HslJ